MSTPDSPGQPHEPSSQGTGATPDQEPAPFAAPQSPAAPGPVPQDAPPPAYGQHAPPSSPPAYGQHAPASAPTGWEAGQASSGTPGYGAPGSGAPQPGPYGQPAYGAYGPAGRPGPQAWTATDRPGIVPLRPLTLGEIFDGSFGALRHNPRVMLGLSALVLTVATLVGALLAQLVVPLIAGLFGGLSAGLSPAEQAELGALGLDGFVAQVYGLAGGLSVTLALVTPVLFGILTVSVSRSVLGDKLSVQAVWDRVRPRLWVLIGWSLLQGLGATVLVVGGILLTVVLGVLVSEVSGGLAALVVVLLVAALVVVGGWLYTRLLLVPAALVLEGQPLWATVRRAWLLTRGVFWRLLGITLLANLLVGVLAQVVGGVVGGIGAVLVGISAASGGGLPTAGLVVTTALSSLIGAIVQVVFVSGVTGLLYVDTRMRREGFDVTLTAAAQQVAAQRGEGSTRW
jgi:hypothetical protein